MWAVLVVVGNSSMSPSLITTSAFGASLISPDVPSSMVIEPEFVPSLVFRIRSFVPSVEMVAVVVVELMSTLVSSSRSS